MKSAALLACLSAVAGEFDDSGYMGWFADELDEVFDAKLTFEGHVPEYLRGTFVQAGPARFSVGEYKVGHVFDGFGKINTVVFGADGASFTSSFAQTEFLRRSEESGKIAVATLMGETVPPSQSSRAVTGAMDGHNDNNYIKAHRVGGRDMMLSDTTVASCYTDDWRSLNDTIRPAAASIGLPNGHKWTDTTTAVDNHICMSGIMAHGFTDTESGIYTGAMGCSSVAGLLERDFHIVYTIDPDDPTERKSLAKIPLPRGRQLSVMHSMGHTARYVVLIAHPLHMSTAAVMEGKTMTTGLLTIGENEGTVFQVVDRRDGSVRSFDAPPFFAGHVVNAFEDGGDVVVDFTWYHADEHLMFYGGMLFENMDKETRDSWPNSVLKRFRLREDGTISEEALVEDGNDTSLELPKVSKHVHGEKYCIFYAMHSHSYDYGADSTSRVPGPFGAVGVAKRNVCTGALQGMYVANEYPAEVEFVPDPSGQAEDDGVLVGLVFDGNSNTSFLQVVDAKTMTRVARAPLPLNVPFPVHASFFPSQPGESIVV